MFYKTFLSSILTVLSILGSLDISYNCRRETNLEERNKGCATNSYRGEGLSVKGSNCCSTRGGGGGATPNGDQVCMCSRVTGKIKKILPWL